MIERTIPADGTWDAWSSWEPCSVSCGVGQMVRRRRCLGPQNEGQGCSGDSEEFQSCDRGPCPGRWTHSVSLWENFLVVLSFFLTCSSTSLKIWWWSVFLLYFWVSICFIFDNQWKHCSSYRKGILERCTPKDIVGPLIQLILPFLKIQILDFLDKSEFWRLVLDIFSMHFQVDHLGWRHTIPLRSHSSYQGWR